MVHRLEADITVLDSDVSEIRLLAERYAGVLIEKPAEVLVSILGEYLSSHRMTSSEVLVGQLRDNPSKFDALLEQLLPGDTSFFRHPAAFEALEKTVLPEIRERKWAASPRSLRIWSAGCSTGEEAYSIGISVCQALNGGGGGWNVHIVGSDIRNHALRVAERGLYPQASVRNIAPSLVAGYFSRVGDHLLIKPRLRNLITFAPMNLGKPAFIGKFDCIFCMDVLPHFSLQQRTALLQNLHLYLEPGGYLFLGQNEKLPATQLSLIPRTDLGCTYYQRGLAAAAKSGR